MNLTLLLFAILTQDPAPREAVTPPRIPPHVDVVTSPSPVPAQIASEEDKQREQVWLEDTNDLLENPFVHLDPLESARAFRVSGMAAAIAANAERAASGTKAATGWVRRGPVGGFGSPDQNGRVAGLRTVSDGAGNAYLYVGAAQGGLWRTHDDTWARWEDLGQHLPNPAVRAFDVYPGDPDTILVATGEMHRQAGAGMFRTTDGGATWTEIDLQAQMGDVPSFFMRLHHLPDDPDVVVAASWNGLLRSTDAGLTWSYPSLAGGAAAWGTWTDLVLHPDDPQTQYAVRCDPSSSQSGVYRSTDGGANWTQLSDPALPAASQWSRGYLAICRTQPDVLALSLSAPPVPGVSDWKYEGVFRSQDGGTSWSNITANLVTPTFSIGGNQVFHTGAIAIHPTDPDNIFLGLVDISVTEDGGQTWKLGFADHGIEKGHADFSQIHFSPLYDDRVMFMANDGGVYWHDLEGGITLDLLGNSIDGLAISEVDDLDAERDVRVIGLQDTGSLRSVDSGASWTQLLWFDGGDVEITDPVARDFWHGFGVPWSLFAQPFGMPGIGVDYPEGRKPVLTHDPHAGVMYAPIGTEVKGKPDDHSGGWFPVAGALQPSTYGISEVWCSKVDGKTLWVSFRAGDTSDGDDDRLDLTVLREGDAGWVQTHHEDLVPAGGSFVLPNAVLTVTPSREWSGEAWVGLGTTPNQPKLLHTTDWGGTWEDLTGDLVGPRQVLAIAVKPFDPDVIYIGTELGVFRTTDGGTSWTPFQENLPSGICTDLRFVLSDMVTTTNELVLSIDGRGTWSRTIAMDPVVFVDRHHSGYENGSYAFPYDTVLDAVTLALDGSTIAVKGSVYVEPQLIERDLRIVTWAGTTTIE